MWAAPTFQSNYGHSVDLSAFMTQEPSAPPDDPPPYTEQLLEGHVSLMYGTKQQEDKDETEDQNTSILTADFQNRSVQSGELYSEEYDGLQAGEVPSTPRHMEYEIAVEGTPHALFGGNNYADDSSASDIQRNEVMVLSSTPTRVTRPRVAESDPFYDIPSLPVLTPSRQLFERPAQSNSIDNSTISFAREHPAADMMSQTLPDLPQRLASLTPPATPFQQGQETTLPRLRQLEWTPNNPFIARPTRLPPLRSRTTTSAHQQRKRAKRRRGHSWHGGSIGTEQNIVIESPVASVPMASVAE